MRPLPGRESRSKSGSPATVTRKTAQADQRRRILRATGELVAKRGYNAVTVELIVKRAKVSYKTFYNQFRNKEECFLALFDTAFAIAVRRVDEALDEAMPWPDQIVAALRAIVDLIDSEPIIARACIVEAPTAGPVIFERYERASTAFVPLFAGGRKLGAHDDQLPETLEVTLAGSVQWSAYQRLIAGEGDRLEDLLPELIELVLRPYLGEKEAARRARPEATGG